MIQPQSILEAIKMGHWDYEPLDREGGEFDPTTAMPGSSDKLETLAERAAQGLPLWHPRDRRSYDDVVSEVHRQA